MGTVPALDPASAWTVPIFRFTLAACLAAGCAPSRTEPDWIRKGSWEEGGYVVAVGVGTGFTEAEARERAVAAGRAELARIRETRVRAGSHDFMRSVWSEAGGAVHATEEQRFVSLVETDATAVLGATTVLQPFHENREGANLRSCVRVRIGRDLLFPADRLKAVLADTEEGMSRAAALAGLADEYEGEGSTAWTEIALRIAVSQPGAPAAMLLKFAWFLQNRGDGPGAFRWARVVAEDPSASGEEKESAARIVAALRSDLVPVAQTLDEIDRLAVARADPGILRVTRSGEGARSGFVVEVRGAPRSLAFLWLDRDGLAWLSVEGAQAPFAGSRTLDLGLAESAPPSTLYVWALPDAAPLSALVPHLEGRVIPLQDDASDEDKLLVRSLLHALRRCEAPGRPPASARVEVR